MARRKQSQLSRTLTRLIGKDTRLPRRCDVTGAKRSLRAEQLEGRRLLAGLVFDSVMVAAPNSRTFDEITTDTEGNTYLTGTFQDTVDFDPSRSHPNDTDILTALGSSDRYVAKYGPNHDLLWVTRFAGGAGRKTSIEVGSAGRVYISGEFAGSADFGATTLSSLGGTDLFAAMLDANGSFQWAKGWGSTGNDLSADGLAIDSSGNVTTGGWSQGVRPPIRFLRQFDSSGNLVWNEDDCLANSVSITQIQADKTGNIYIAGSFLGTADFDPSAAGEDLIAGVGLDDNGFRNGYISKFSSDGQYQWTTAIVPDDTLEPTSRALVSDFVIDETGDIALVGNYLSSLGVISPANREYQEILPYTAHQAGYFIKLDAQGEVLNANPYWTTVDAPPIRSLISSATGYYALTSVFNGKTLSPAPEITDWIRYRHCAV